MKYYCLFKYFRCTMQYQFRSNTSNLGLFNNKLLMCSQGFDKLTKIVEKEAFKIVRTIIQHSKIKHDTDSYSNVKTCVTMVDDLSNLICCAADLSDCVRNMHSDEMFSKAAEESMRKLSFLVEYLNTMPELYNALKMSLQTEKKFLDEISLRTAKLLLEDFENSGVHLNKEKREEFVRLSDLIFLYGSDFVSKANNSTEISIADTKKYNLKESKLTGTWSLSNDYQTRKFAFCKFFKHNEYQEENLRNLIKYRTKLANLTGFETFAHRAQLHTILQNYDNVKNFLNNIVETAKPILDNEVKKIKEILINYSKNYNEKTDKVGEWDIEFANAVQKQKILKNVNKDIFNYFLIMSSLLNSFELIINQLYNLSFQLTIPNKGEIWPGNVVKLNVYQDGSNFLGTIYIDVDTRPTKVQGDCHFTVRCSKQMDNGTYQTPVVVISLSLNPTNTFINKSDSNYFFDSLKLNMQQAENFFHEMGHAIHSMLGRTKFQHVSGTRCPTDFAEVPSHLMECFFNDPKVLHQLINNSSSLSVSYDETLAIVSSRHTFHIVSLLQQTLYSLLDLTLHGEYAKEFSEKKVLSTNIFNDLADITLPNFERPLHYAYHHRITHLVTYGAKYYSYLIARSTANLIYKDLFNKEPFSKENGLKWGKIQSYGGEYSSDHLIKQILGKSPSIQELTSVLVKK